MPKQSPGTCSGKGHCTSGLQTAQVCGQHTPAAVVNTHQWLWSTHTSGCRICPLGQVGLWNCTAGLERCWKGATSASLGEMLPGSPECLSHLLQVSGPQRCSAIPAPCTRGSRSRTAMSVTHRAQPCTSCHGDSHPSFLGSLLSSVPERSPSRR